jgi:hypothetical protein
MEGRLAAAGLGSVRTLAKLQESAVSESIRLSTAVKRKAKGREASASTEIDAGALAEAVRGLKRRFQERQEEGNS